ncbi:MAG: DUF2459 domain-containing protein [Pseudomonadota bacterium]
MALIRWSLAAVTAVIATLLGAYGAATFVGAIWRSPAAEGPLTRTIYVVATPIHAEIVVPIEDDVANWRPLLETGAFPGEAADHHLLDDISTHAAIGWGAQSFYFNVHTLSDIRLRYVLDGLWDDTAVHVTMLSRPQDIPGIIPLSLTESGYRQLVEDLEASFAKPAGEVEPVPGESYFWNDGFFEGAGTYSPVVTCNVWVGALLRRAGVSVGRFTPFTQTLLISLGHTQQGAE